jgi:ligand-binding sensor domain-containing protein
MLSGRKSLLLLLTCLTIAAAHAQRALLRHYTVRDGLPSNTIYDISQDSKGFIWFSTDQGISRFDGHLFRNFSIRDGLPDNEVFSVTEDDYHRFWVACYNKRACYLKDGKVYHSGNDSLCRQIEQAGVQYHTLQRDMDGHCCLVGKRIAMIGKDHIVLKGINAQADEIFKGMFVHGGQEYFISNRQICRFHQGKRISLITGDIRTSTIVGNDLLLFCLHNRIPSLESWRFEGAGLKRRYHIRPAAWIYYLTAVQDTVIACTEKGLSIYNPANDVYSDVDKLPANTCNNRWMRDVEGNEWFTTANNGVYLQLWAKPLIYDDQSGLQRNNILSVGTSPYGDVLAGNDQGGLSLIRDRVVRNFFPAKFGYTNRVRFIFSIGKHELISGADDGVYRINTVTGKYRSVFIDAMKAGVMRRDHCLFASFGNALRYDISKGSLFFYWKQRTTAIEESRDGTLWLGTLDGLYCKSNKDDSIRLYQGDAGLINQRITALLITPNDNLAIGTSTNGLFIHSKDTILHLSEQQGLSSNSCRKIATDLKGNLWLCTDNGLDRIDLEDFPRYKINTYTLSDGLPNNKLNDVAIEGDQLYLATSEGIIVLNNKLNNQLPAPSPRLYITAIDNHDIAAEYDSGMIVRSYDRNNLQVSYTGISFAGGDNVQYKYFLEGGGRDTIFTTNQTINFSALSPGDYRLVIWARNKNGCWTDVPSALPFRILPPWWRKPWFLALSAFLMLLSAYLIYRWRISQVKKKAAREVAINRQMAALEMKALRAQINPHFIFNALNSIQTYYSNNDELRANHYMSAFAQFVRKTLTHSQSHWLPLSEELLMLQTYIELEQMRFKQVFSFELVISEMVRPEQIVVPAMLIQPYVENAINHGLRHLKDRAGALSLRFTLQHHCLVCVIDDNGVGFPVAQQKKPENHQSFGMHINRQRIETINQLYHTTIQMTVIDKQAVNPSAHGTAIEIIIPLKLNTDHAEYANS